ncbi:MAG: energy-coupling factor transporter transmembrane protein EcfT [Chloroflexi bacterium]|nr:energy-coupling factor transporter transmembrane protein EcfT [Chloroflexota bacterium]
MLAAWKYRPRDTLIQRLDPRSRLVFLACLILAVTGASVWDMRLLLPLFILSMALYFLARIEWRDVRRAWAFMLFLVIFIVGLNGLLAGRGGPTVVLQDISAVLFSLPVRIPFTGWGFTISITVVRSFFALTQIVRMLTLASLAIPIPYTMDPSVYGVAFRRLGLPDKSSFTMDLAFRFIPTLGRDFFMTVDAQRARGYEVESARGGIVARLRRLAPLVVPVTMQAIVTGEDVIDAMDLRAFGSQPRTWMRELHFERRDYLYMGLGAAILLLFIAVRVLGYGDFWVPEFWYALAG